MAGDLPSAPPNSMPKGGGALRGMGETFQPNPFSGTAHFSVPIFASPCRGAEPHLTLSYNAGGGNGAFGLGFDVPLPAIARKTEHGIPEYTGRDIFVLSGAEDLVPEIDPDTGRILREDRRDAETGDRYRVTRYFPKYETAFDRIERWQGQGGDHWRITSADNSTSFFGQTPDAREAPNDGSGRVFKWLISRTCDGRGNLIDYHYRAEDPDRDLDLPAPVRYLDRVRYGRIAADPAGHHLFEMVFDYGERDLSGATAPVYAPGSPAKQRADPFSSFRAGFERRTGLLCRGIVLYHRLGWTAPDHAVRDVAPFPVHVTAFDYHQDPAVSHLARLRQYGFRDDGDGPRILAQPRLDFDFSRADPAYRCRLPEEIAAGFKPGPVSTALAAELERKGVALSGDGASLSAEEPGRWRLHDGAVRYQLSEVPGLGAEVFACGPALDFEPLTLTEGGHSRPLREAKPVFVDLLGEGLPGVLTHAGGALHYARPAGQGRYEAPRPVDGLPGQWNKAGTGAGFRDQTYDGLPDLILDNLPGAGFFENTGDGTVRGFRPFSGYPTAAAGGRAQKADLTGDGIADTMVLSRGRVRYHPSRGPAGFAASRSQIAPADLPELAVETPGRAVRFADIYGDGGAHLVQITRSAITCWPSHGHGRFGAARHLVNPPQFGPDFDAARVILADLDGSGTADLIYVSARHADIYRNLAGNGFGPSERVTFPYPCGDPGAVQVTDILGNGTAAMVISGLDAELRPRCAFLDFSSRAKPHLLCEIDDMAGVSTRITHIASTEAYLASRRVGAPWRTRLPFPVQLVARTCEIDHISGARHVMRYRYHDGHYDSEERRFRGFGRVDTLDCDSDLSASEAAQHPPQLVRRWYHSGRCGPGALTGSGAAPGHWPAPHAPTLTGSVTEDRFDAASASASSRAPTALFGRLYRQEVFAADLETGDGWQAVGTPHLVVESNFEIRLVQDATGVQPAVLTSVPREQLQSIYEDDSSDPRIHHRLTLAVDRLGHVTRRCEISYPRCPKTGRLVYPEQAKTLVEASVERYCPPLTGPDYRHGQACERQRLEIFGLDAAPGVVLDHETVRQAVEAALTHPVPACRPGHSQVPEGPGARVLEWERHRFWDAAQSGPLPLGRTTGPGLHYQSQIAWLEADVAADLLEPHLEPDELTGRAGLIKAEGLWWRPGSVRTYGTAETGFHQIAERDVFGADQHWTYDPHNLLVIATRDTVHSEVRALALDPHALRSVEVVDENKVAHWVSLDPLGRFQAGGLYDAAQTGGGTGDPRPGPPPKLTTPASALAQGDSLLAAADMVELVDALTWQRHRRPPWRVRLERADHASAPDPGAVAGPARQVSYFDGRGQVWQSRTGHGTGSRAWLVSGIQSLDHKGAVAHSREPYFHPKPDFETKGGRSKPMVSGHRRDALGREIETAHPGGFLSRKLFGSWSHEDHDANDCLKDSPAHGLRALAALTPDQRRGAVSARRHHATPRRFLMNGRGQVFLTTDQLSAKPDPAGLVLLPRLLDADGAALAEFDPREVMDPDDPAGSAGAPLRESVYALDGTVIWTRCADTGVQVNLPNCLGRPIFTGDARGFQIRTHYDRAQRPVCVLVRGGDGPAPLPEFTAERMEYGGPTATSARQVGRLIAHFDQAGLSEALAFDLQGQALHRRRRLCVQAGSQVDWSPTAPPPEMEPHALARVTRHDAQGRVIHDDHLGQVATGYNYWPNGWLKAITLTAGGGTWPVLAEQRYDARGVGTHRRYGNGVTTDIRFADHTRRLEAVESRAPGRTTPVQALRYAYDPVGNVTSILDRSHHGLAVSRTRKRTPDRFTYDALYRLIAAEGREDALQGDAETPPKAQPPVRRIGPGPKPMLSHFTRHFTYDKAGTLTAMTHRVGRDRALGWERRFVVADRAHRVLPETAAPPDWQAAYDANGNRRKVTDGVTDGVTADWDFQDRLTALRCEDPMAGAEASLESQRYNAAGTRLRHCLSRGGATVLDQVAFGDVIIDRAPEADRPAALVDGDRLCLAIHAGAQPVARLDWRLGSGDGPELIYQLHDDLGAVALELDAAGKVLSYVENYPFGPASFAAEARPGAIAERLTQYAGKPMTALGGLSYFGARYYDPATAAWLSPDPAGEIDGPNLYAYVGGNPMTMTDQHGFVRGRRVRPAPADQEESRAISLPPIHHLVEPERAQHVQDATPEAAAHMVTSMYSGGALSRFGANVTSRAHGADGDDIAAGNAMRPAVRAMNEHFRQINLAYGARFKKSKKAANLRTGIKIGGKAASAGIRGGAVALPPLALAVRPVDYVGKQAHRWATRRLAASHEASAEALERDPRPFTPISNESRLATAAYHRAEARSLRFSQEERFGTRLGIAMENFRYREEQLREPTQRMANAALAKYRQHHLPPLDRH